MTNVLDAEFLEECALKTECHVWEAEASINNARCESALEDLWFQEDPERMERYFGSERREFLDGLTDDYMQGCAVERAAYDWRREHGEWPSTADLTERLAAQAGISRRAARIRIEREVNDLNGPSADHHLYIIPEARLRSILTGEPLREGEGSFPTRDARFYVAAPGQARCAVLYDLLRRAAA